MKARAKTVWDRAWFTLGLYGECAPASCHRYYEQSYNSPEGQIERAIMAEQVLSEFALEQADGQLHGEQGEQGETSSK